MSKIIKSGGFYMTLEERVGNLEKDLAFITGILRQLASGTAEALPGIAAELVYIKSHLGLTQAAPDTLRFK